MIHITDTRIASVALGLGFVGELQTTVHSRTRETQHTVVFNGPSTRFPGLNLNHCITHWKASRMREPLVIDKITLPAQPLHAYACGMRAQLAYDAMLGMQKTGAIYHLIACAGGWAFKYDPKIELDSQVLCETTELTDLSLCATLAPLGIPLLSLRGSPGQRVYHVARNGFAVRAADGVMTSCDAQFLTRRAPTPSDPLHLALEDEQPMHPVCMGYDSLIARQALKKMIMSGMPSLIITDPEGTAKQALVSVNYKGHVGESVCRHFKVPASALGI